MARSATHTRGIAPSSSTNGLNARSEAHFPKGRSGFVAIAGWTTWAVAALDGRVEVQIRDLDQIFSLVTAAGGSDLTRTMANR
jgi:hypothetical protein